MKRASDVFLRLCNAPCIYNAPKAHTREIPTRRGLPLIGTSLSIIAAGSAPKLHKYIHSRHKESGLIFRENMGTDSAVFIADPDIMRFIFSADGKYPKHFLPKAWTLYNQIHKCKRGLFFMDGEQWHSNRKILNKHFLKNEAISELAEVHDEIVNELIHRLRKFEGQEIEKLEYEFYRHSISFVIGSLLGSGYITNRDVFTNDISKLAKTFQLIFETSSKLVVKPVELTQKFGLPSWNSFETAVQTSISASREMVRKMLNFRSSNGLMDKIISENIEFEDLVAIVADLMLAAGDTTAYASQWALYLLAREENIQNSLLENPELVKGVVRETLRLYPPAVFITRFLPETVSYKGYTLEKEELLLLSMYTVGRNEDVYPCAEQFLPQRWLRNGSKYNAVNSANAFLPFALGARSCIGAKIALAQLTLTLQQIVKQFELSCKEDVEDVLKLVPVPNKPIKLQIKFREAIK